MKVKVSVGETEEFHRRVRWFENVLRADTTHTHIGSNANKVCVRTFSHTYESIHVAHGFFYVQV